MTEDKNIETCEWCSRPSFYKIEVLFPHPRYVRYACSDHTRKIERQAYLDLPSYVVMRHTSSSEPFKRDVETK